MKKHTYAQVSPSVGHSSSLTTATPSTMSEQSNSPTTHQPASPELTSLQDTSADLLERIQNRSKSPQPSINDDWEEDNGKSDLDNFTPLIQSWYSTEEPSGTSFSPYTDIDTPDQPHAGTIERPNNQHRISRPTFTSFPSDDSSSPSTPLSNHSAQTASPSQQTFKARPLSIRRPSSVVLSSNLVDGVMTEHVTSVAQRIPSELILHIFKYVTSPCDLSNCLLTCKLWCDCGVELLWYKPAFTTNNIEALERLLHTLDTTNSSRLYQNSNTIGDDTGSGNMILTYPYSLFIRRLNLSMLSEHITDDIISKLSWCARLERITLAQCARLTDVGIKALFENSSSIQGSEARPFCGKELAALDLSDCGSLTDKSVIMIAESCPKLQGLYLGNLKEITDAGVQAIAKKCKLLRRIKLTNCEKLTDASIMALATNCPQLLEIDLTNCHLITNSSLEAVFKHCTHLRDFKIQLCSNISDAGFQFPSPVRHTQALVRHRTPSLETLRILDLTSVPLITDLTLTTLLPHTPRLRNLVLAKCSNITDIGVMAITTLGKHLHYLHLGHCAQITDRAVIELARNCTRIRYLDLAGCTQLTDRAVFQLAALPKLRRIGLVRCSNLTDDSILALIENRVVGGSLERVHLSYCVNLTRDAITNLVNFCGRLTHLSLTGVPAFRDPEIQRFCRVAPREFNPHQREVFCVFSGKGVRDLRRYLNDQRRTQFLLANLGLNGIPVPQPEQPQQDDGDLLMEDRVLEVNAEEDGEGSFIGGDDGEEEVRD